MAENNMWKREMIKPLNSLKKEVKLRQTKDTGLIKMGPMQTEREIVDEELLYKLLPVLEQYYNFWLAYPDKLVDFYLPADTVFGLYPFQRLGMRANARHKQTFQVAGRGYSKSFVAVLGKIMKCISLPGSKETMVAEHKNQAAQIGREKIEELIQLMPLLDNEIDRSKGAGTTMRDDFIRLVFKNGSQLDLVGLGDSTRGGRRHGILLEEVKDLPAKEVNEVVLPLLNISRTMRTGELNHAEKHQQQTYVGSAGYKNSFAYNKCIETTIMAAIQPDNYFSWGGSYKIPMYYGLLNKDFVQQLRTAGTYDDDSFSREFLAKWTNTIEGSFFDYDKLSRLRTVKHAEFSGKSRADVFYIASVDVARHSARTIVEVFKVHRGTEHFNIKLVNIIPMEGRNFHYQSVKIKELDAAFGFMSVVVDANGLGSGLVDFLMMENEAEDGTKYSAWNVENIKKYSQYAPDQKIGAPAKIFIIKTNQHSAGDIHSHCYQKLYSGHVHFLIDEKEAKENMQITKIGQKKDYHQRMLAMEPFKWTTVLINETSNLKLNRNNTNLKLERIQGDLEKDTFSALEYGLWYLKEVEQSYYASLRKGGLNYAKFMRKN